MLTVEIPLEIQAELAREAQTRGVAVPVLASLLLQEAFPRTDAASIAPEKRSAAQIRAWLDSLAEFSDRIPAMPGEGPGEKLTGHVEADETFIGQKARNMHKDVRARKITGTGGKDKTTVMGILERGKYGKPSTVRTTVVSNRKKKALQAEVRQHVQAGAALYTDSLKSYDGMNEFKHEVVDHAVEYVRGNVHTNGLENFWSLLKRGLHGTYVSVEPFHLLRYLDEQTYRFNNRKMSDSERFDIAVRGIVGKRLTWDVLTGKDQNQGALQEHLL